MHRYHVRAKPSGLFRRHSCFPQARRNQGKLGSPSVIPTAEWDVFVAHAGPDAPRRAGSPNCWKHAASGCVSTCRRCDPAWVRAEQDSTLIDDLVALAERLGIPKYDDPRDRVQMLVTHLAQLERPWLLVFDNAIAETDIAPYVPDGGGMVLVTSRNRSFDRLGHVTGSACSPPPSPKRSCATGSARTTRRPPMNPPRRRWR